MSGEVRLSVVIPTRNRGALAMEAIRSLLGQSGCRLQLLVSDNSSLEEERNRLEDFCRRLDDPRVVYVRPPVSLSMGEHWDWAMREAMTRFDATHFTIHYDRRICGPQQMALLTGVATRFPERLITYPNDLVISVAPQLLRVKQIPTDGKVYEIAASRVLERIARGNAADMTYVLPLLCNCVVPRAMLERIEERFGSVCDADAPDVAFSFRFLALHDRHLHFHQSIGVLHAFHRSHALGFVRGKGGDFDDFIGSWGDRPWLEAAPIPGLTIGQNMLFHEYVVVQRSVGGKRFPPIEMDGYLRELARALICFDDEELKARARAVLEQHGWREEAPKQIEAKRVTPRRVLRSLAFRLRALVGWSGLRQRVILFLADHAGIPPSHIAEFEFASEDEAVRYAIKYPRRRPAPIMDGLAALQPAEVGFRE